MHFEGTEACMYRIIHWNDAPFQEVFLAQTCIITLQTEVFLKQECCTVSLIPPLGSLLHYNYHDLEERLCYTIVCRPG